MNHPAIKVLCLPQPTNLAGTERTTIARMKTLHDRCGVSFSVISPSLPGQGWFMFQDFDPGAKSTPYRGKYNLLNHAIFSDYVAEGARDCDLILVAGTSVTSLRAALATGRPVILTHHFHHGQGPLNAMKWKMFYELLCRKVHHIIYVSDFIRDEAIALCPWLAEKSSALLPLLPSPFTSWDERENMKKKARQKLGLPPDAWIIGNSSQLIRRKRVDVFLDVAKEVARRAPDSLFVLCGDGDQRGALQKKTESLSIADQVRFMGWKKDLSDDYWAWDLLLFNSDSDAAGRTLLEAMSYGMPVVASCLYGGVEELLGHDRGLFVPTHDIGKLADHIIRLKNDPGLRARIGEAAARYIHTEHAAETQEKKMMAIIDSALRQSSSAS